MSVCLAGWGQRGSPLSKAIVEPLLSAPSPPAAGVMSGIPWQILRVKNIVPMSHHFQVS